MEIIKDKAVLGHLYSIPHYKNSGIEIPVLSTAAIFAVLKYRYWVPSQFFRYWNTGIEYRHNFCGIEIPVFNTTQIFAVFFGISVFNTGIGISVPVPGFKLSIVVIVIY